MSYGGYVESSLLVNQLWQHQSAAGVRRLGSRCCSSLATKTSRRCYRVSSRFRGRWRVAVPPILLMPLFVPVKSFAEYNARPELWSSATGNRSGASGELGLRVRQRRHGATE
ncbi:hypothetical protein B296_00029331 [Ensete ventricosum]|uniref:Uncharacterized protein n=1 Tax=Ensete ventricosum TaxID=4639 RepID=A0A426Z111_ENSVE|nr:hypothetical protein B296_00029331 [Ensete ventricosum]